MVTPHQERSLRKFYKQAIGWERTVLPGIREQTWDGLVELGYLEEKREGGERFVRLSAKGKRAMEEGLF